ncbi:MAG: hypothetical protein OCC45_11500 [Desulfotalea sp.]
MKKKNTETLYCSFCGKSQFDVNKIIAGSNTNICEGCVNFCIEVIADVSKEEDESLTEQLPVLLTLFPENTEN